MSKLTELIEELCSEGVEFRTLKEVCKEIIVPQRDRPKVFGGEIPWCRIEDIEGQFITSSKLGLGVTKDTIEGMNLRVCPEGTVLATCSASLGVVAIAAQPLVTNQTFIGLVCDEELINKYLHYFLLTQERKLKSLASTGTIPYISRKKFEGLCIPVPPLEVQREIVRVLDAFTALEQSLVSELELRKKQFEECLSEVLRTSNSGWKSATLGDIGSVRMCKRIMKHQTSPVGDVPFFKIGSFGGQPDAYIPRELFEEYRSKYSFPKVGDILISAAGTIGRTVKYDGEAAYFQDSNIVWLENDETEVTNDYLYYWYKVINWTTDSGTIKRLYNKNLLAAGISYPNKAGQEEIVAKLDTFDSLIESIEQEITLRRKQYEFYRDELLSFAPKED